MGGAAVRRYTSGMKIAVLLSRHRRLLALCGLSACAHLLLLELVAQRAGAPATPRTAPAVAPPLALRLARPAPRAAAEAPPARRMPSAAPGRGPAPAAAMRAVPPRAAPAPAASTAASAAAAPAVAVAAAAAAAAPIVAGPAAYRVDLPPSARLVYRRQDLAAAGAPAYLDWQLGDSGYTLDLDGILGLLSSRGRAGDRGLVPAQAGEIVLGAGGVRVPTMPDVQDPASVLVQLAAIGRGAPGQLQDQVGIAVVDAGTGVVNIVQYRVLGEEDVETGIGTLAALHLAQLAAAGQPQLELWLAPSQEWMPVRLRLTAADGSVATQVLTSVERAPAQP